VPGWGAVFALTSGIAMLVASEFLPASVLPAIAADLGVTEGMAGLAISATAVAGFFTAPTIAVVLPRTDRRTVLAGLLAVGALADVVVAGAPSFAVLLVGRLLVGIAVAGYWSFAFAAGVRSVPGRPATVSTTLALGVSFATVAAVPLASLFGDAVGWRVVFVAAGVLTAGSAVAVRLAVPPVPADPGAGLAMLRRALGNRRLMAAVVALFVTVLGNFAAFPYVRLAIERVDPAAVAALLLAWGLGGAAGNWAAGALASRLRVAAAGGPALFGAALLLLAHATSLPLVAVAVVAWGFGMSMVPVASQLWVTRVDPARTEPALALQVTAFQLAITLGAAVGGQLLDATGLTPVLTLGAVLALAGAAGFAALRPPRG
jgi:DHA1 family purine ribonucleoside efflux pump-like MFS transporter